MPAAAHPGEQPRAARHRRRNGVAGAAALAAGSLARDRPAGPDAIERLSAVSKRCGFSSSARRVARPAFQLTNDNVHARRADLLAARRHSARHRTRRRAHPRAHAPANRRAARRPLSSAHHRQPHRRAAPANAPRADRLEPRSAHRTGAHAASPAVGLRPRAHARSDRGGVRGRWTSRRARSSICSRSSWTNRWSMSRKRPEFGARYFMLESIWDYAREKLVEAGEESAYRERHLDYFLRFAEELAPKIRGAAQLEWLARLEQEDTNLRVAVETSRGAARADPERVAPAHRRAAVCRSARTFQGDPGGVRASPRASRCRAAEYRARPRTGRSGPAGLGCRFLSGMRGGAGRGAEHFPRTR